MAPGASGILAVYSRECVPGTVASRGAVPGEEDWVISDVRCRRLSDTNYALTYQPDQDGRLTRRLTLWRRDPDGWKILYHQGTPIADRGR